MKGLIKNRHEDAQICQESLCPKCSAEATELLDLRGPHNRLERGTPLWGPVWTED